MIQRIQTIHLLVALALLMVCLVLPMAELTSINGQHVNITILALAKGTIKVPFMEMMLSFYGYIMLSIVFIIFQFKRRKKQMVHCIITGILLIGLNLLWYYQISYLQKTGLELFYKIPFIFPLIGSILMYLAYRGVKKDEELVRSNDRIR